MAGTIAILVLLFLYFMPTIVAVIRQVPNLGSVVIINLFLGWSFLGWVISMAMAARSRPAVGATVHVHQAAGAPLPGTMAAPAYQLPGQASGQVPQLPRSMAAPAYQRPGQVPPPPAR